MTTSKSENGSSCATGKKRVESRSDLQRVFKSSERSLPDLT